MSLRELLPARDFKFEVLGWKLVEIVNDLLLESRPADSFTVALGTTQTTVTDARIRTYSVPIAVLEGPTTDPDPVLRIQSVSNTSVTFNHSSHTGNRTYRLKVG